MFRLALAVVLFAGAAVAVAPVAPQALGLKLVDANPPKPNISETFNSKVSVHEIIRGHSRIIDGDWAIDQNKKAEYERFHPSQAPSDDIYVLGMFGQGEIYEWNHNHKCHEKQVHKGAAPKVFNWIPLASYVGKRTIKHKTLDTWAFRKGKDEISISTYASMPNTPVFLVANVSAVHTLYEFFHFDVTPPAGHFHKPTFCPSQVTASTVKTVPSIFENFYASLNKLMSN